MVASGFDLFGNSKELDGRIPVFGFLGKTQISFGATITNNAFVYSDGTNIRSYNKNSNNLIAALANPARYTRLVGNRIGVFEVRSTLLTILNEDLTVYTTITMPYSIIDVIADGDFVWLYSRNTNGGQLKKLLASNASVVSTHNVPSSALIEPQRCTADSEYLYLASGLSIVKYKKNDGSFFSKEVETSSLIQIEELGNFLFVKTGYSQIRKLNKSDLNSVSTTLANLLGVSKGKLYILKSNAYISQIPGNINTNNPGIVATDDNFTTISTGQQINNPSFFEIDKSINAEKPILYYIDNKGSGQDHIYKAIDLEGAIR